MRRVRTIMSRRTFTKEFKKAAVAKLRLGTPAKELARACDVDTSILRRWQREMDEFGARAFGGYGKSRYVSAERRAKAIVVHLSSDEFDAVKTSSAHAGFRSLAEFARSRMFHSTSEPPQELLEGLSVVLRKVTQALSME